MSWREFGPEWNPVLVVLAALAALCVLATLQWWLGVAGLAGCFVALGIYFGVREW